MKHALLHDLGLDPYVAAKLAEGFDRVSYFTPYSADAFPVSRKALWGKGLPGVTRVQDFFDQLESADIVVFPDHGQGDLQAYLKSQGLAVWGSGLAEVLELDRVRFRRLQRSLRIPAPKTIVVKGTEALRAHLETVENVYVKLSEWRGDVETFHHESAWLTEPWLKDLEHRVGPIGDELEFLVEDAIEDAVEVGFDGVFAGGRFLSPTCYGYEVKDIACIDRVCDYDELPDFMLEANAKLVPILREMDCRSWVSLEYRVTEEGVAYLIDPALRIPSPPGGAMLEVFSNWPEIVAAGARNEAVAPIPKAKYMAELVLRADAAEDGFVAIDIPEEVRDRVKLHGHTQIDGVDYVVALGMDVIGGAVGIGDTVDEACEQAIETAKSLKAYGLEVQESGLDIARERIERGAKDHNIPWSD